MLKTVLYSILNAAIAFTALITMVRIIGRKAIAQMTFFELAVTVSMGSLTANLAMGGNHSFLSVATILASFGLLAYLISFINVKSFRFRKMINSEPVTVIENGRINEQNLRKVHLTVDKLMPKLREKNIFAISDVEFAIMESDGEFSVLPKAEKSPLTPSDMMIPVKYKGLTRDIIMDGHIMDENLTAAGFDRKWLLGRLEEAGVKDSSEVFYAGLDSQNSLYISEKKKRIEKEGQHGIE